MAELTQLTGLEQVRDFMVSLHLVSVGRGWATLTEIAEMTGVPEGYVSANLKHLRETKYGGYLLQKRHRENVGSYEYRLTEKVKVCKSSAI